MVGIAAVSQVRTATADNFGLSPQSVATPGVLLVQSDEKLSAFIELESGLSS
jgi:hypothetical protein